MEITEQERQSLIEMTIALSEFLNSHELDDIIRVYLGLIERLKMEGNELVFYKPKECQEGKPCKEM